MEYKKEMKNGNKYSGFVFLIQDYKNLLNHLDDKLSSVIKNNKMKNCQSTLEYLEMSIDQPKKYVIDYISLWDTWIPQLALNWLISHPRENWRFNFVDLLLKEQPDKNFWEALQDICKIWNDLRSKYSYNELIAPENKKKIDSILFWFYWSKVKSASIFLFK